jgi:hypothetical protein
VTGVDAPALSRVAAGPTISDGSERASSLAEPPEPDRWSIAPVTVAMEPGLARSPGFVGLATRAAKPGSVDSLPVASLSDADVHAPFSPVRATRPDAPTGTDVDDLFEQWAERLEQAAEQLGIDLEA